MIMRPMAHPVSFTVWANRGPPSAAVADVEAPGLVVGRVGVRHHFHVLAGAGEPDLDVALAVRREVAGVAGALVDDAVGQLERLQQPLVVLPELLVDRLRLVCGADGVHLDLVELVHALDALDVLAPGAGLGAEAGRRGEDPQRQLLLLQRAVHEVAEVGGLGRPDQEQRLRLLDVVGLDLVDLVAALGEVRRAVQRPLAHQQRRDDRDVAGPRRREVSRRWMANCIRAMSPTR